MMTVLSFIIAISILVVIHEYGHFWVARRCGVKVLRFSVGFGKPFWSFKDKHGTEFAVAPLPLGGYVKMLDEREGPVAEEEKHQAFTQKTASQRIAIAAAGPIANFLFAILAYWALYMMGVTGLTPVVGKVDPQSPLAGQVEVGDRILSIGDEAVTSYRDFSWKLISYIGDSGRIELQVETAGYERKTVGFDANRWLVGEETPDPIKGIGLYPRTHSLEIPAIVGVVTEGGAADLAGILPKDRIVAMNGIAVQDWYGFVDIIRGNPGQTVPLTVERLGDEIELQISLGSKVQKDGTRTGFAGVGFDQESAPEIPADWFVVTRLGPADAFLQGIQSTWDLVVMTLDSLWKMIQGDVSVKNLSGPITIAKVAGSSASGGIESFISFLALLSVSLGVLNLLPVPVLDGGHILYYSIEAIRRKPLSEKVQILGVKIGMAMLLSLMLVAFYNDISRL